MLVRTVSPVQGFGGALNLASSFLRALEADAERKADPTRRTSFDLLVALLAIFAATSLVLSSIAFGWWVLWRTTLHKIGLFRDMMGLNRAVKADAKRRTEAEIQALKSQISQQHGFGQHQALLTPTSYGKEN
ncbi:hypothetical protein Vretimale_14253 [Volvox reticuliferus]|uniref:Uncharacterized protein n=1 Tax=Volvox reticuliferus TaxID=1737510 RepID=A0A8J4LUZ6_9CHLO|nr:hypothetical protein Vretifemale_15251 [Volvox reticuliferus]GIM10659.1 hypothetical protein Vretimale_14253 [Volvox reticuliferus]